MWRVLVRGKSLQAGAHRGKRDITPNKRIHPQKAVPLFKRVRREEEKERNRGTALNREENDLRKRIIFLL